VLAQSDAGRQFACTVTARNLSAITTSATSPIMTIQSAISGQFTVNRKSGVVTFIGTVSDPGTLHWLLTFQNGKFGVFAAKKAKCATGEIKLKGRCRPTNVVYASGSTTATAAGTVSFTATPTPAGKKAFKHARAKHRSLGLNVTLSFQSAHGGSPVTQPQTITVRPARPKHRKHTTRAAP
jgi:hypothetical protein